MITIVVKKEHIEAEKENGMCPFARAMIEAGCFLDFDDDDLEDEDIC